MRPDPVVGPEQEGIVAPEPVGRLVPNAVRAARQRVTPRRYRRGQFLPLLVKKFPMRRQARDHVRQRIIVRVLRIQVNPHLAGLLRLDGHLGSFRLVVRTLSHRDDDSVGRSMATVVRDR